MEVAKLSPEEQKLYIELRNLVNPLIADCLKAFMCVYPKPKTSTDILHTIVAAFNTAYTTGFLDGCTEELAVTHPSYNALHKAVPIGRVVRKALDSAIFKSQIADSLTKDNLN